MLGDVLAKQDAVAVALRVHLRDSRGAASSDPDVMHKPAAVVPTAFAQQVEVVDVAGVDPGAKRQAVATRGFA
jgi:hypothetical protein